MILLHRITPFIIALVIAAGSFLMVRELIQPLLASFLMVSLCAILFARLSRWNVHQFSFWFFVGTPIIFLSSSFGFLLFLEQDIGRWLLLALTTILTFLFAEHIFAYLYAPPIYRPNAIEYLSLVIHLLTIFMMSVVGFGSRLFLQTPIWRLSTLFFLAALFIVYSTLWVSKVDAAAAKPYALCGALLSTELFAAILFLPSGMYTSAALITLFFYLFLGLSRAHVLNRLSVQVLRRYLSIASIWFFAIILTAIWV